MSLTVIDYHVLGRRFSFAAKKCKLGAVSETLTQSARRPLCGLIIPVCGAGLARARTWRRGKPTAARARVRVVGRRPQTIFRGHPLLAGYFPKQTAPDPKAAVRRARNIGRASPSRVRYSIPARGFAILTPAIVVCVAFLARPCEKINFG